MTKNGTNKGSIRYMKLQFTGSFSDSIMYKDSVRLVIKDQKIELERIPTIMAAIDLSSNHFEGVIPKPLKDLGSLRLLNLCRNNLRGDIPLELGQLNRLEGLDLSWNWLNGMIPQQCGTSDPSHVPQPLELDEEDASYFVSGFTWESVVIGYSCGLVVGTVMWSLMFKARKPKWVVEFLEGTFPKKMRRAQKRRQRRWT
ncbi:receptor-like protein Cf-9 homolog [Lycium barbarum]|uniref:receptor-like protein Cf-9 homolog n=1 Tax=Lycium barbarum TaxID=112863 RepID=UPI00293EA6BD|nr:receptor-like protein Cf-9 homolog [Lycium barbarum]